VSADERPTRFPELRYRRQGRGLWRVLDSSTGAAVGPHYGTRSELLADLERYAAVFGATGAAR
jgi:hypothetical protein